MSKMLAKMNLISAIQQLPEEDIEAAIQGYVGMIEEENEKLKKQLEEYIKQNMKLKDELFVKRKEYQDTYKDVRIEIKEYKIQQKEFIKYLEDEIEACELTSDLIFNHNKKMKIYKEILQKYKSIIGVSDGNN